MSARPKPKKKQTPRREKKTSGVKTKAAVEAEAPEVDDPFAEFHDGWEPVRRRRSQPPSGPEGGE